MYALNFTSRVLGKKAAERLKQKGVTQTLRDVDTACWCVGCKKMSIALDGNILGAADHFSFDMTTGERLTQIDAERGGFNSIEALTAALKRAGYRFKLLSEYEFCRVQFQWLNQS